MNGRVEDNHAFLPVSFRFEEHSDVTLEFVVDTGFVGELTLPLSAVEAMGLRYINNIEANLADDSVVRLPVYLANIIWRGEERSVLVLATGKRPLLGMGLLSGSELVVQCQDDGLVTVEEL